MGDGVLAAGASGISHLPVGNTGSVGWEVKIPFKPSMLNLPSIFNVKYFLMRK